MFAAARAILEERRSHVCGYDPCAKELRSLLADCLVRLVKGEPMQRLGGSVESRGAAHLAVQMFMTPSDPDYYLYLDMLLEPQHDSTRNQEL